MLSMIKLTQRPNQSRFNQPWCRVIGVGLLKVKAAANKASCDAEAVAEEAVPKVTLASPNKTSCVVQLWSVRVR
jgi:hypothetical protein